MAYVKLININIHISLIFATYHANVHSSVLRDNTSQITVNTLAPTLTLCSAAEDYLPSR